MDKGSDYKSGDLWFKSSQNRNRHCPLTSTKNINANFNHPCTTFSIGPVALLIRRLASNQNILGLSPNRVEVLSILILYC